jgi:23S rRNA (cytidine1920-2'-O)/16S rRNA (cytidine1409-2'-O)-methyltransferase
MKIRLDVYLAEKCNVSSREKAKALIMAGQVYVNNQKAYKAGEMISDDAEVIVKEDLPFVSRGGYKLDKAVKSFHIDLKDKICIDIGASTGGFTDCMLQNGAKKVYAVDVGYGQLDWKLRSDERVIVLERTNSRYLTEAQIPEKADFLTADVAFISLNTALATVVDLILNTAKLMVLIKPQFEAGREFVGKKGVVKDKQVHRDVIIKVCEQMANKNLAILDIDFSPIKGPEGNIEYLLYMTKEKIQSIDFVQKANEVTDKAHNGF